MICLSCFGLKHTPYTLGVPGLSVTGLTIENLGLSQGPLGLDSSAQGWTVIFMKLWAEWVTWWLSRPHLLLCLYSDQVRSNSVYDALRNHNLWGKLHAENRIYKFEDFGKPLVFFWDVEVLMDSSVVSCLVLLFTYPSLYGYLILTVPWPGKHRPSVLVLWLHLIQWCFFWISHPLSEQRVTESQPARQPDLWWRTWFWDAWVWNATVIHWWTYHVVWGLIFPPQWCRSGISRYLLGLLWTVKEVFETLSWVTWT